MLNLKKPIKQSYNEEEAAHVLGVTVEQLYSVLDEHVFTDGQPRPGALQLTHSDLLLLSIWTGSLHKDNVISMPAKS